MAVKALSSRGRGVASTAQSLQGEEVLMLSVRANDRGATPVGDVEVESRIRGNVYVRFGEGLTGDLTETPRFLFHQNLAEALEPVFTTHDRALQAVNAAMRQQPVPLPDGTVAV